MKRTAVLVLMAMLVAVGASACASESGGNSPAGSPDAATVQTGGGKASGEVVTVRMNLQAGEITEDQIAEFEKENPGIKIQREDTDPTKLAAQLATGDAPDLIRVQGVTELPSYVIKGIAMDLTSRIESSDAIKADDLLPVANVYRFDGKTVGQGPIYGLPKDWSPDFTLFYNKQLFDAADVPVPDAGVPMTWNQVFDLAKQLTIVKDNKVQQYGLALYDNDKTEAGYPMLLQFLASKGADLNANGFDAINFDTPEVKEFFNLWSDAVAAGIGPNSINNDTTPGMPQFVDGKVAMIAAGYWFSGVIRGDEKAKTHLEDYGMLPAPIAEGGIRVSPTGGASGLIINKNTKHPEEAWKFFEWFFVGKPAQDRASLGWGVPITGSLMSLMPQEMDFDKRTYEILQSELQYTNGYLTVNPYLSNANTLIQKYMTPVYFKKSTVDDAVKSMTKDANIMISESKGAVAP
ncbi:sugar ABC transporter substrate-binding protein [Paenibacillus sp. PAMC21692]|uniref:ABC transporter substrate-binding protein n=1 Tax=Paenibacillus sp. PAMC21692 TaxID=2762320 RepID=UPI00164D8ED9|nr:sugar ABC transporter substrate-binding protein [Paenibacillus sp. PAMC21692]QNK56678.1 sugar ABC transporter substrate-binding protein [Paenibacillus sp. PAMC21692]